MSTTQARDYAVCNEKDADHKDVKQAIQRMEKRIREVIENGRTWG